MAQNILKNMAQNLPQTVSRAINDTLVGARTAVRNEMAAVFKPAPTPRMKDSILFEKANPGKLFGSVYISNKDLSEKGALSAVQILYPQIFGGSREVKRSEATLRGIGVMAGDQFIVPGPAAKRDQYGNISGGEMIKILSAAGLLESEGGYKANQTIKSRTRRGGLKMQRAYVVPFVGVFWYIPGQKVTRPILFFTQKPPTYRKIFDFHGTVISHVKANWGHNFSANYRAALSR